MHKSAEDVPVSTGGAWQTKHSHPLGVVCFPESSGAKDFYLKALVLLLSSGDAVSAQIALERYVARDPRFEGSREGRLATALVAAMQEGDAEAFTAALDDFDRISKLDPWKIHFLLKAKRRLMHGDEGGDHVGIGDDGEVDLS
ncbi:soluble NSF attachment protein [Toxoplasma gondii CAST]|uniref:Soluble NSF attachment protein n=1 Tax=Toxoplasma gondii CAST TaxID=943122 RepID=A0A425HZL1_TOXGO|nr:soluble NSF attachment protein [Toxoplasma gondii CAST]